ncbi:hypothetical protein V8D89_000411 [Ganoderma adspersum]
MDDEPTSTKAKPWPLHPSPLVTSSSTPPESLWTYTHYSTPVCSASLSFPQTISIVYRASNGTFTGRHGDLFRSRPHDCIRPYFGFDLWSADAASYKCMHIKLCSLMDFHSHPATFATAQLVVKHIGVCNIYSIPLVIGESIPRRFFRLATCRGHARVGPRRLQWYESDGGRARQASQTTPSRTSFGKLRNILDWVTGNLI